jgi:hypothetical protein
MLIFRQFKLTFVSPQIVASLAGESQMQSHSQSTAFFFIIKIVKKRKRKKKTHSFIIATVIICPVLPSTETLKVNKNEHTMIQKMIYLEFDIVNNRQKER